MIKIILNRKGQNMAEYAIIFGIVIAAAVGISALIKTGIQDRVAGEVSKIGMTNDTDPLAASGSADFTGLLANTFRDSNATENITVEKGGKVIEGKISTGTTNVTEGYTVGN